MTIDAGVHFWKYEKATAIPVIRDNKALQEDYLPVQLSLNMKRNGVDACVAVAAGPMEVETRFLSELAITHSSIAGVIGWIDLQEEKAAEKIAELSSYTPLRGFKLAPAGEGSLPEKEVMAALASCGYSLELELAPGTSAVHLSDWVRSFPEQLFVLDRCGSPDARHAPDEAWTEQIRRLAVNKNLYCKVSGLLTLGNWKTWKPADFYPFLDILFEAFGPNRLLYASDWPFLLLSGSYVQWKSLLEKYTEQLREEEREKFFGENARRLYRL